VNQTAPASSPSPCPLQKSWNNAMIPPDQFNLEFVQQSTARLTINLYNLRQSQDKAK
jgi:hypothetical protein